MGHLLFTVTVPSVPVSVYGDGLLSFLGGRVFAILPYAAAVTVFVISVAMLKRWIGHRNAYGVWTGSGGSTHGGPRKAARGNPTFIEAKRSKDGSVYY